MKCIVKGLLPALMVSMLLFSCSKENTINQVEAPKEQAINVQAMQPDFGDWVKKILKRRIFRRVPQPLGPTLMYCDSFGGRCLPTVVIKGSKLANIFDSGSQATTQYFSGNEWKEHFSPDIVGNAGFVEFMTNEMLSISKADGAEGTYYMLNNNGLNSVTAENANIIIPIGQ